MGNTRSACNHGVHEEVPLAYLVAYITSIFDFHNFNTNRYNNNNNVSREESRDSIYFQRVYYDIAKSYIILSLLFVLFIRTEMDLHARQQYECDASISVVGNGARVALDCRL